MQTLGVQHLLNMISDAYPGLVAYIDKNYRYIFVNKKYFDWLGLNSELLPTKLVSEVHKIEDFELRKPYMDMALNGKKVKFIAKINNITLGKRETEETYYPDVAEDGSIRGFVAMAYDITDQKIAEREMQENDARFRSLTEVMPQLVWVADGAGNTLWMNENWPRVTGTTLQENLGTGWLNVIHPEDRVTSILNWKDTLNGDAVPLEYRLKMADGSYRWHVSRAIPIKDDFGKIVRWVGTTTDIEEQKSARELADKEKERIYSLFMQAPVVILVLSGPDHIVEMMNPAGEKYVRRKNLRGKKLEDTLPEFKAQGLIQVLDEIYFSGEGKSFNAKGLKLKQLDGTYLERHFDLFYEPIKDENNLTTGILGMAVDVTEQVEALKWAEEKERKLEEALITRDQFLSIASHELKTPLTSLKLQAQLTLRALTNNKNIPLERQLAMAHQTNDLVGRLTRLIDDMLDVSRIKTGKLKLDKSVHELGDIIREVVFRMSVLFEAAGLQLPSIESKEKMIGEWDRFRLEQVMGNLLTNAIRYGQGKPIKISLLKKEHSALLAVKDNGYGISPEDCTRIFGRFERAINSSEVSGLGLGLFISKEIIDSHGGKIWVESELGLGSTFYVELPFRMN